MKWMYDQAGRYCGFASYPSAKAFEQAKANGFGFVDPIDGVEPEATHFINGEMRHRPTMAITQSAASVGVGETVVFTAVPDGADVVLDGVSQGAMDAAGKVEMTFDDPGIYQLRFDKWPAMPAYFAIDVS